jgi:hypothetical protein
MSRVGGIGGALYVVVSAGVAINAIAVVSGVPKW